MKQNSLITNLKNIDRASFQLFKVTAAAAGIVLAICCAALFLADSFADPNIVRETVREIYYIAFRMIASGISLGFACDIVVKLKSR